MERNFCFVSRIRNKKNVTALAKALWFSYNPPVSCNLHVPAHAFFKTWCDGENGGISCKMIILKPPFRIITYPQRSPLSGENENTCLQIILTYTEQMCISDDICHQICSVDSVATWVCVSDAASGGANFPLESKNIHFSLSYIVRTKRYLLPVSKLWDISPP